MQNTRKPNDESSSTSEIENKALAQAIVAYLEKNEPEEVSQFTAFLDRYKSSSWRVFPRKVFMTQVVDSMGNAVTLTYDASLRLRAITDAIGQVTSVAYEDASNPLRVTKVTDPFLRFAKFDYFQFTGLLQKITDVINLTSEFLYAQGDLMGQMTTPYGPTSFSRVIQGNEPTHRTWTV